MKAFLVKEKSRDTARLFVAPNLAYVTQALTDENLSEYSLEEMPAVEVILSCAQTPFEEFFHAAAQALCVTIKDLRGPSRHPRLPPARAAIAYLLKNRFQLSLYEIARLLNKHHTSVVYYLRAIQRRKCSPRTFDNIAQLDELCEQ